MKYSCLLIGEQSLLVQCGGHLLASGHSIVAVVATNDAIVNWCSENNITCFAKVVDLTEEVMLNLGSFDYLFSITNLKMLPASLLNRAEQLSINFHDGPLPKYAGLNAPVWALISGEQEHGVSWHVMTAAADKGDLLQQDIFSLSPNDTSFTLNAKCYQAAYETFVDLVGQLENNKAVMTQQDESLFTYYGLSDRPRAAATIDWNESSKKISSLVKALNFGPYPNPVAAAKIYLGDDFIVVGEAALSDAAPGASGQIMGIDSDSLSVSTADAVLVLKKLSYKTGQSLDVRQILKEKELSVGDLLPALSSSEADAISRLNKQCCKHESFWDGRLAKFEGLEFPYRHNSANQEFKSQTKSFSLLDLPQSVVSALGDGLDQTKLAAVIALLLGRLGMKQDFGLGVSFASNVKADQILGGYFSEVLPLLVAFEAEDDFESFSRQFSTNVELCQTRVTFALDLMARQPNLQPATFSPQIEIQFVDDVASCQKQGQLSNAQVLFQVPKVGGSIAIQYASNITEENIDRLMRHYIQLLQSVCEDSTTRIADYCIVSDVERRQIDDWNKITAAVAVDSNCIHQLFEQQCRITPDVTACVFEGSELSYTQFNERANQLANYLLKQGVNVEDRIGILLDRSIDMMVALMATLKAGCCYVPLDPVYPADRIQYMVEDAGLRFVLVNRRHETLISASEGEVIALEDIQDQLLDCSITNPVVDVSTQALAYVIYTSGSTGKPKGVMIEHRNAVNFFKGMDERVSPAPGIWLAVTSISFDISVLEIFWTLCRGFTVALYADDRRQKAGTEKTTNVPDKDIDFNLFYWNVAEDESEYDEEKYRLLIEGAKFADNNGFNAVWTPERHFAAFGGLFPNPSITSAALATITNNIELRAGSCVAPLHSPIRIAEEWAMVDNLSGGRVGIAVASGWAPPDFAIKPENFTDAKNIMFESVETVRKLWRGETVLFPGPNDKEVPVRTLPRPIQKEIPIWITTAGNIDSYVKAAEIGANLLTHLLGQTLEEVEEKVKAYRAAWKKAGHPGRGKVTLMLHTLVGPDLETVEQLVHEPLKKYLKSAMFLVKSAAWQFPTFKKMSEQQGKTLDEFFETISEEDMDGLLEFAFQRYFNESGLFGTVESCLEMVDKVKQSDIEEVGCLIDYGIDTETVLTHLPYLAELLKASKARAPSKGVEDYSIPALFEQHEITHLQCTPSMATMLSHDESSRSGLKKLKQMMVGGEAFPPELAAELSNLVEGRVTNMYGPTESTIWSSTADVKAAGVSRSVSIGKPLINQYAYILDEQQNMLPIGVPGELVIGGEGVVRGYHNRDELTADRFVADRFFSGQSSKMYRTGDLARWGSDGSLECLGRIDHQVKIRGYRVELGEIEALLGSHEAVLEVAVVLREDTPGDQRLVAYVRYKSVAEVVEPEVFKAYLQADLPEFMVPSIFVEMSVLPLTPNGKIDRKALPEPQHKEVAGGPEYEAPNNDVERLITEIWQRALGISRVGTRENFFDIGGHSLLVVQVLKELRDQTEKPIQMTDLFRFTTVEALARFISGEDNDSSAVEKGQARAAQRKASMGRRRRSRR